MESSTKSSRKKFLGWGAGVIAALTAFRFFSRDKKNIAKENPQTVKMLTQDGHLVEVDKNLLASGSKKISTEELKQWVNKKSAH